MSCSYEMQSITQGDSGQLIYSDKERVNKTIKHIKLKNTFLLLGAAAITWTRPISLLACWDRFPCLRAIHRVACPPAGVSIGHWNKSIIHTIHTSKYVGKCSVICPSLFAIALVHVEYLMFLGDQTPARSIQMLFSAD